MFTYKLKKGPEVRMQRNDILDASTSSGGKTHTSEWGNLSCGVGPPSGGIPAAELSSRSLSSEGFALPAQL